jgi:hypothetical protein
VELKLATSVIARDMPIRDADGSSLEANRGGDMRGSGPDPRVNLHALGDVTADHPWQLARAASTVLFRLMAYSLDHHTWCFGYRSRVRYIADRCLHVGLPQLSHRLFLIAAPRDPARSRCMNTLHGASQYPGCYRRRSEILTGASGFR